MTGASLGHELGNADGEGKGRDTHDDGKNTDNGGSPTGDELQIGSHQDGLDAHEEEGDGRGSKAGEHLRGLKEGLGKQREAVLLLDLLLDVDHNDEDDNAQDSHG